MNPETRIELAFVRWCKANKVVCLKLKADSQKGLPDRFCLLENGKTVFIEFKTETGKLSGHQKLVFEKLKKLGHHIYVCRSKEEAIHAIQTTQLPKTSN
jgi:hypothetical protein